MNEEQKKMNMPFIIISGFVLSILIMFNYTVTPTWFDNYIYTYVSPDPEMIMPWWAILIMSLFMFPALLLINFWNKALWNNIVPIIFNFRKITYWECFALTVLMMAFLSS